VVESALGVVTGDVGAGKTVALRAAVAGLDPTRHRMIYVSNPAFGTRGLYVTIVRALGAQPRYLKAELMAQASDLLAAETAERHRRVVVLYDEAHLLQPDQLEELRLLTNSEMDSASPFAGILAGQPTLNRQLRMGMFAALDQRIATRFLQPFGGGATRCMSITLSPRPVIRSTSPDRAAWSGSSARRVVVPGPTMTSQSSNSARSVEPA